MSNVVVVLASAKEEVVQRWRQAFDDAWHILEAHDKDKLVYLLRAQPVTLALIHLAMPELHDGETVAMLHELAHSTRLLTFSDKPCKVEELSLLRSGMHGYMNTYAAPRLLRRAVKSVAAGEMWVSRVLLSTMFEELREANGNGRLHEREQIESHPLLQDLTAREREIAVLVSAGNSNNTIADRLGITERTVKTHLSSIFEKTGSRDRVQLAVMICRAIDGQCCI